MAKSKKVKYEAGQTIEFNNNVAEDGTVVNLPGGVKEKQDGSFEQTTTFGRGGETVSVGDRYKGAFEQIKQAFKEQQEHQKANPFAKNQLYGLPASLVGLIFIAGPGFLLYMLFNQFYWGNIIPITLCGFLFTVGVFCFIYGFCTWGKWMEKRRHWKDYNTKNFDEIKLEKLTKAPHPKGVIAAMIAMGLIFASVGGGITVWKISDDIKAKNWPTVQGQVIGLVEKESSDDDGGTSYTYAPRVSFTVDGVKYEFTSSVSSNPPSHKVGDSVTVRYDPNNPNKAKIDGEDWGLYIVGIAFFIAGMGFAIGGVVSSVRRRKQLKYRANQI